ncbi:MAG: hypothetical protein FD170_1736 [Bacteroidetes bacterium]|nr:MAG: hypothetical protein FD170_1736 [Bacteroidota bacterium]
MKKLTTFLLNFTLIAGLFVQTAIAQITVSGSNGADGNYTSLTNAGGVFAALNVTSQAGQTITITVTADVTTELGTTALTGAAGLWTSLTINPSGARTISGNVDKPLIDLNGAQHVIIDGVNTGGNSLTIENLSTSTTLGTSTIRFINNASNNVVKNCTIKGSGRASTAAYSFNGGAILFFSTSSTTTGNNNNLIDNNVFTNAGGNRPKNVIFSYGSIGAANDGNTISNNMFYDFFNPGTSSNGIFASSYSSAWNITGNTFYETTTLSPTASSAYCAMRIGNFNISEGRGNNFTVSDNFIGGNAADHTGTFTINSAQAHAFIGIYLNVGETIASTVQNNTITRINFTTTSQEPFYGIRVVAGNVNIGTVSGNTIGSATGNGSITITTTSTNLAKSIGISFGGAGTVNIENNTIGGITIVGSESADVAGHSFNGIEAYTGFNIIRNNTIGSTDAGTTNSIWANTSTTTGKQHIYGIYNEGATSVTISENIISQLTNAATGNNSEVAGIKLSTLIPYQIPLKTSNITNNIISLGGETKTTIYGIYETGNYESGNFSSTNNIYFNTVYIGGTVPSGSAKSYALYSAVNTTTRNFRNNIFNNARSTTGGSGLHYAMYIVSTGGPLTCDFNDYLASGTGGMLGYYGADKSTPVIVTGQDTHSLNTDPLFASAGGSNAVSYIPSAALAGVSISGITTDYAGTTRASTPTMGAYEVNSSVIWDGSESTDWNTAANWSTNAVPSANADVTIPDVTNDPVVASGVGASCNNLTVNSGASLTVNSGGSLITNGTVTGDITIQREISGSSTLTANKYHLVSVPLHPDNNSLSGLFLGSYLFSYNPVVNEWVPLGIPTDTPLDETTGYMIYFPGETNTYSFTGQPNTGVFTPTVTYAGNSGGNNFALVPNPYPSNIDWNALAGWTRTNIGNSIWVYNNGSYSVWDGTNSTNNGSRYIAVGQSFFIQTTAASPVLLMDNYARTHTSATFLKNTKTIENQLRVKALANSMQDEIIAGFAEGMSAAYDPMEDALKLYGAEDAPQLYTLAGDSKVSINQLAELNGSAEIPMHFETEFIGEITLDFSQMESFPADLKIRLEDKLTGQWVNLRETSQYLFTHNPANATDRFILHFGSATGMEETETQNISSWFSGNTLYLSTPEQAGEKARIEVFNTSGQLLFSKDVTLNTLQQFDVSAKGMIISRVTLRNKVLNTKAIVF